MNNHQSYEQMSILHSNREKLTCSDAKIAWFNLTP